METDDYLRAVDLRPISGSRLPAGRNVEHVELEHPARPVRRRPTPGRRPRRAPSSPWPTSPAAAGPNSRRCTWPTSTSTLPPSGSWAKAANNAWCPSPPPPPPCIEAWLAWRGDQPGPLFCPIDRGDNLQHSRTLSGEAIRQVLCRRSLAAGVKALSPHDLRRTYAGDLLDAGADLPAVQQLLGHASPATTSRYDRRGDKARRTAAERLHLEIPSTTNDDGLPG